MDSRLCGNDKYDKIILDLSVLLTEPRLAQASKARAMYDSVNCLKSTGLRI